MNVEVILFAAARDLLGKSSVPIELEEGATIAELKSELVRFYPALNDLVGRSAFAVDQVYADDEMVVGQGQEIAMIPPVSGG